MRRNLCNEINKYFRENNIPIKCVIDLVCDEFLCIVVSINKILEIGGNSWSDTNVSTMSPKTINKYHKQYEKLCEKFEKLSQISMPNIINSLVIGSDDRFK